MVIALGINPYGNPVKAAQRLLEARGDAMRQHNRRAGAETDHFNMGDFT